MCELLVKAIDVINVNKDKDRAGCYKRGMTVLAMDDGHEWGKEERPPKFFIVKMPGIKKDDPIIVEYCQPELKDDPLPNENPRYRRREWQIQTDELSNDLTNKMSNIQGGGAITLRFNNIGPQKDDEWENFRGKLKNMKTNLRETRSFGG